VSAQRVTPSKLGRASIRSIWARTLVAVSKSGQQIWYSRKRDGSRGEHIIGKSVGVLKGINGNTRNGMMETQGLVVPWEKEDSRIDRCQCSGTRIITRAVIRDGIEWGDASMDVQGGVWGE